MKTVTAGTRETIPTTQPRQALWLDFQRALDGHNFVRAAGLARELSLDEGYVRRVERDALKQYIAEYQNFDAASRLRADYRVTAEELAALTEEALKGRELESQRTLTMRSGKPEHLNVTEQIRGFARRELEPLKKRERREAGEGIWKRLKSFIKSWLDRWFNPWQGGFPHGGPACG